MAITSQFRAELTLGGVWLDQWQTAGLLKLSAIKPVFATLEESLIPRRLGKLSAPDERALEQAIGTVLG